MWGGVDEFLRVIHRSDCFSACVRRVCLQDMRVHVAFEDSLSMCIEACEARGDSQHAAWISSVGVDSAELTGRPCLGKPNDQRRVQSPTRHTRAQEQSSHSWIFPKSNIPSSERDAWLVNKTRPLSRRNIALLSPDTFASHSFHMEPQKVAEKEKGGAVIDVKSIPRAPNARLVWTSSLVVMPPKCASSQNPVPLRSAHLPLIRSPFAFARVR